MLLLAAAVIFGFFLFNRSLRLEGASDPGIFPEKKEPVIRAYVDGKPVKSSLKE